MKNLSNVELKNLLLTFSDILYDYMDKDELIEECSKVMKKLDEKKSLTAKHAIIIMSEKLKYSMKN